MRSRPHFELPRRVLLIRALQPVARLYARQNSIVMTQELILRMISFAPKFDEVISKFPLSQFPFRQFVPRMILFTFCMDASMTRTSLRRLLQNHVFATTFIGVILALGGFVQADWSEPQSPPAQETLVDLLAVFTTADASVQSIQLVSLEELPQSPLPPAEAQASTAPIYELSQPGVQVADGNIYTGPSSTRGTWVLIAPYGWIAGVNGEIGIGNQVLNVDLTPGQALAHLGSVDGALMLHMEVGKGDWGFILDGNLIRASTSVQTLPAQVDVTLQQTLLEGLGMYRLVEASDYFVEGKSLTVDLLAGGRYYQFGNAFVFHPSNPVIPSFQTNNSSTWVDMIIGARTRVPVTHSLDAFARADVGGFGMGSSSTLAWNLIAGVDWKMTACSSLIAGYRQLDINKHSDSGSLAFDFNARLYGPFMALAFQF